MGENKINSETLSIIEMLMMVLKNVLEVFMKVKSGEIDAKTVDLDALRNSLLNEPDLPEV